MVARRLFGEVGLSPSAMGIPGVDFMERTGLLIPGLFRVFFFFARGPFLMLDDSDSSPTLYPQRCFCDHGLNYPSDANFPLRVRVELDELQIFQSAHRVDCQ